MDDLAILIIVVAVSIVSGIFKSAKKKKMKQNTTSYFDANGKKIENSKEGKGLSALLKKILQDELQLKVQKKPPTQKYVSPVNVKDDGRTTPEEKRGAGSYGENPSVVTSSTLKQPEKKAGTDIFDVYNKSNKIKRKYFVGKLLGDKNSVRKAIILSEIINKNRTFEF